MVDYKRSLILSIVTVVALLIAVGVWFFSVPSKLQTIAEQTSSDMLTEPSEKRPESDDQQAAQSPEELLAGALESSPKLKKIFELGQTANRNIEFHGKVVDQAGERVGGAKVTYSIPTYEMGINPSVRVYRAITDESGRFTISGHRGLHILIRSMEKPGYSFENVSGRVFRFLPKTVGERAFEPDKSNPIIFRAWRKDYAARELVEGDGLVTPIVNGEPRALKFPGTEESVSVTFAHSDGEFVGDGGKRRWSAVIEVKDGGIIVSNDIFMYEAPEVGYQSAVEISGTENEWVKKRFYLKALNGKVYGRIEADTTGYYGNDQNRGAMDIKYVLNPTGSRNLLPEDE